VLRRGLTRTTDFLLPLAAAAGALALVAPSTLVAERTDVVLAALVLFTALTIAPSELAQLRACKAQVAALVLAPFALLVPLAWAASRPFDAAASNGMLALGVSSTEVAAVGMVALAGGRAALALGALTGSLVVAALAGPPLLGLLAGAGGDVAVGELVGRFALVVIVPLAGGLAIRAAVPHLGRADEELGGLAAMSLVALVYGAMSGTSADGDLLAATGAGALFLALSAIPVAAYLVIAPRELRLTGSLVIGLRDFAVAAALASQAFGPPAATVAGAYGVLMLLAGAAGTQLIRRRLQNRAGLRPSADQPRLYWRTTTEAPPRSTTCRRTHITACARQRHRRLEITAVYELWVSLAISW
jgi:BASS family bile acid:Na+ symporter